MRNGFAVLSDSEVPRINIVTEDGIGAVVAAGWTPDTLTTAHEHGRVMRWNRETGSAMGDAELDVPGLLLQDIQVVGGTVYSLSMNGTIRKHGAKGGRTDAMNPELGFIPEKVVSLGEDLIVVGLQGELLSIDPQTLAERWRSPAKPFLVGIVAIREGKNLLASYSDGRIELLSGESGAFLANVSLSMWLIKDMILSPDGLRLYLRTDSGSVLSFKLK